VHDFPTGASLVASVGDFASPGCAASDASTPIASFDASFGAPESEPVALVPHATKKSAAIPKRMNSG
jgi:hypothetical protein